MWALRVQQKEAVFYLASYPAGDLLRRVMFERRVLPEAEQPAGARKATQEPDEAQQFISTVVGSKAGFQRPLVRRKIREIQSFIELASIQPPIPATVLLYTPEKLRFDAQPGSSAGNLGEPREPFTIVDGQHRLAGLKLYLDKHPEDAHRVYVPLSIFDKRAEDFAAEMFVIVNSTHSKIARSLLIDLMETVTMATREQRVAARVLRKLYEEARSPLRYRINRLGGRSGKDKWILQAQLYNEMLRILDRPPRDPVRRFVLDSLGLAKLGERPHAESELIEKVADRVFMLVADWYKASARAFGEAWGNPKYAINRPDTLQALARVLGDQLVPGGLGPRWIDEGAGVFDRALARGWSDESLREDLRMAGFYERFAAKGTPERIRLLHRRLAERLPRPA